MRLFARSLATPSRITSGDVRSSRLLRLVAAGAIFALAAGCSNAAASDDGADPAATASATKQPPVILGSNVDDGATDVPVSRLVNVTAIHGELDEVTLTYSDPKEGRVDLRGKLADDGSSWSAEQRLEPATAYSLSVVARNGDGETTTETRSFTTHTLSDSDQVTAAVSMNGNTVGIAMPVIISFSKPIKNKIDVERSLEVISDPPQPGGWGWFRDNEIHYRPVEYWKPGTTVKVNANINGIDVGKGRYGRSDAKGSFTVRPVATTARADVGSTHQMEVFQNGELVRTVPISGGRAGDATRDGIKVIIEKRDHMVMDAETIGIEKDDPDYYNTPVDWAMRVTWSGEFIHSAPWSVGSQGRANVSHGCTNVSPANGEWLFENLRIGDPVEFVGSGRPLKRGNGWTDWNISFEEFVSHSALTPGDPDIVY